jgi:hypothetical protein
MHSQASRLTLGLLPEPRTRWEKFVVSYGVQTLLLAFCVIAAIANPDVLDVPIHDYHFVSLVSTPPPVPQTPAPVKNFPSDRIGSQADSRSGRAGAEGISGCQQRTLA